MNSLSLFSRYNPAERKLFFLSLSFSITPSTSALVVSPLMNNKSYLFACFLVTGRGLSLDFPPLERGEVGGNLAGNLEDDDRGEGEDS